MRQYKLEPMALERLGRLRAEAEAAQLRAAMAEQAFSATLGMVCRDLGITGRAALRYTEGVIICEEVANGDG